MINIFKNIRLPRITVKRDIAVFDLDGTLALIDHRRHLISNGNRQWDEFYRACVDDLPNWPVIRFVELMAKNNLDVFIASGRSDLVLQETLEWLSKHGIEWDKLVMRKQGDSTPDDELKLSWLNDGTIPKERVKIVFDDRDKVVKMWRGQGLTCLQVAEGNF